MAGNTIGGKELIYSAFGYKNILICVFDKQGSQAIGIRLAYRGASEPFWSFTCPK
ncbi:MAG TPA: hypothetical protein PLT64_03015 [Syntrophales bacterium]|nr:hypothetical protein [Syntrophales bacterium]HOL58824.1 hypothetical protein [Syntrophales bacterium]HPO35151.1 hypothetical protein [Syntrophales bacterium]